MIRRSRLLLTTLALASLTGRAADVVVDQNAPFSLQPQAGDSFKIAPKIDFGSGTYEINEPFIIRYGDVVLIADRGSISSANGGLSEAVVEGNVTVQQGGRLWRSERGRYEFVTGVFTADRFRAGEEGVFVEGAGLSYDRTRDVYTATDAMVTSDDFSDPAQRIESAGVTYYPGRKLEARENVVRLGSVPVFYWPKVTRDFAHHRNYWDFAPGYQGRHGAFLLSTYHREWTESLSSDLNLDYRTKRGFGIGPDVRADLGEWGRLEFGYYFTHDDRPDVDSVGDPIDSRRQRARLYYDADFGGHLTAKSHLRWQEDEFIVRDFFEGEYRRNIQPNSFVELQKLWPNLSFNAFVQPQINTFQETVERLPDLRLSAYRQQIGQTGLYYESESSLGHYRRQFANDVQPWFSATRADTFHQITRPWMFFGWLNVIPRVGGRLTYYGEADGPGATTSEQTRGVFNTGAEFTFKASRLWRDVDSNWLQLDGLRHIIQPSVNYVYVPEPGTRPPQLPQFDYELTSLRLLPNEFPAYNAIDSVDANHVARLGVFNRLQTIRNDRVSNLLQWNLFTDYRIERRTGQTRFSDLYSEFDFAPRDWVTLTSETRFDLDDNEFAEANHYLTLNPIGDWSWSFGHRYLRNDSAFGMDYGNNLFINRIYYRMNENWGFRTAHHFEARDGTMEEQTYSIYRDLRSWTGALSFRLRDDRQRGNDFTVALVFSLKSMPRFDLGGDSESPSRLFGD